MSATVGILDLRDGDDDRRPHAARIVDLRLSDQVMTAPLRTVTVEEDERVAPPPGAVDLDELTVEELEALEAIATRLQEAKARNNVIDMEAARRDATDLGDGA